MIFFSRKNISQEIMAHVTTWLNLGDTVLSELVTKTKYFILYLKQSYLQRQKVEWWLSGAGLRGDSS